MLHTKVPMLLALPYMLLHSTSSCVSMPLAQCSTMVSQLHHFSGLCWLPVSCPPRIPTHSHGDTGAPPPAAAAQHTASSCLSRPRWWVSPTLGTAWGDLRMLFWLRLIHGPYLGIQDVTCSIDSFVLHGSSLSINLTWHAESVALHHPKWGASSTSTWFN